MNGKSDILPILLCSKHGAKQNKFSIFENGSKMCLQPEISLCLEVKMTTNVVAFFNKANSLY